MLRRATALKRICDRQRVQNADAEDQTKAYKKAEKEMEKTAANDTVLLAQAQQRVQSMLEDYVKNMGTMLGKEYTITWDIKENHVKSDTAESTE